jgi:hypothetical protein
LLLLQPKLLLLLPTLLFYLKSYWRESKQTQDEGSCHLHGRAPSCRSFSTLLLLFLLVGDEAVAEVDVHAAAEVGTNVGVVALQSHATYIITQKNAPTGRRAVLLALLCGGWCCCMGVDAVVWGLMLKQTTRTTKTVTIAEKNVPVLPPVLAGIRTILHFQTRQKGF